MGQHAQILPAVLLHKVHQLLGSWREVSRKTVQHARNQVYIAAKTLLHLRQIKVTACC